MRSLRSAVAVGIVASTAGAFAACGTSSSSDTSGTGPGGGEGSACVFTTRTSYDCPSQPRTSSEWVTACRDGVDCATLAPATDTVDGCNRTTEIQGAHSVSGTCAQLGGTNPTNDAAAPLVLDAGGPPAPCSPLTDATSFAPTWHVPRAQKGACTAAQIDSFRQCLDDVATQAKPASCVPWEKPSPTDQTCLSCLESQPGDSQWGPLVLLPTETLVNIPGCLALAENAVDGSGCGGALAASQECDRFVCVPQCSIGASDPATYAAQIAQEEACEKVAETGACAKYSTPAQCAGKILQGDAGNATQLACFGGGSSATSDQVLVAVATAFCGP